MGKGSKQRKSQVSDKHLSDNWERCFKGMANFDVVNGECFNPRKDKKKIK